MIDPHAPLGVPPEAIADAILHAAAARGPDKSVCPSEVARTLDPACWRSLMPAVRAAALVLARDGRIRITRRGRAVDGPLRGAIRLRLA